MATEKEQKMFIFSVIAILVLVAILTGFVFRSLQITSRQKLIIEQKNKETEHQKKEIIDSIQYARKIQHTHTPTEAKVYRTLKKLKNDH